MFHGGTNFGLTSGANDKGTYHPITTSYDYDAPLDEAGNPTAKYWAFREVIARHAAVSADVPAATATPAPSFTVPLRQALPLWDALDLLGQAAAHDAVVTADEAGQYQGLTLYATDLRSRRDPRCAREAAEAGGPHGRRGQGPGPGLPQPAGRRRPRPRPSRHVAGAAPRRPRPPGDPGRGPGPGGLRPPHRRGQGAHRPGLRRRRRTARLGGTADAAGGHHGGRRGPARPAEREHRPAADRALAGPPSPERFSTFPRRPTCTCRRRAGARGSPGSTASASAGTGHADRSGRSTCPAPPPGRAATN